MIWFTKEDILFLHSRLIQTTGGSDGIRDDGMLDSSIQLPFQTFDSKDLYPGAITKLTRLAYGLTCDHPFIDGNKRIGCFVLNIGLKMNGININFTDEELIDEFLSLASGNVEFKDFDSWVKSHITKLNLN